MMDKGGDLPAVVGKLSMATRKKLNQKLEQQQQLKVHPHSVIHRTAPR